MALLIHNQAAFVAQMSETDKKWLELKTQSDERFMRIESQMAEIIRVLTEHNRMLERLPEAIRDKIGFKGQQ